MPALVAGIHVLIGDEDADVRHIGERSDAVF
jgi:hypothetical protein